MEGASRVAWWDRAVLPSLVGGCLLTRGGGAEWNGASEPVSSLCDALKPKLHYTYDRYADAYLRAST